MSKKLTAMIPTFNNEHTIRRTIESVSWADEILVVDSFSKDTTLDICKEYGARIIQHEYINSAKQKNWAAQQCRNKWILQIDTDEILEEGSREEIENVINNVGKDIQALKMPRKNHVLGKWMIHCGLYPDFQTRVFKKDKAHWMDREVHAHIVVSGKVLTLKHHILHFGMPDLSKQVRNLDRYTRYEADERRKLGEYFKKSDLFIRPIAVFFHRYFWLFGFLDGWRGLIVSTYLSFYQFLTYAKVWEMEELGLDKSPK